MTEQNQKQPKNGYDVANAKDPDVRAALGALRRAAQAARTTAMQTNTHLVIVKDGRLQRIPASELICKKSQRPTHRD